MLVEQQTDPTTTCNLRRSPDSYNQFAAPRLIPENPLTCRAGAAPFTGAQRCAVSYQIHKHFPSIRTIQWRVQQVCKGRSVEQIIAATDTVMEWIADVQEAALAADTEEFLDEEASRIYNYGGWELEYMPGGPRDEDGRPYSFSLRDIYDLLTNWPHGAHDQPAFPVESLDDFTALGEITTSGHSYDDIPDFQAASEAEVYALLAFQKAAEAERHLLVKPPEIRDGRTISVDDQPWTVGKVVAASQCLIEGMEAISYAERAVSDKRFLRMRAEMTQQVRQQALSEKARAGAAAMLAKDPTQKAKQKVKGHWIDWQKDAELYKSNSAFARDMLDAYQDLRNQAVITRWCRTWEKEAKQAQ